MYNWLNSTYAGDRRSKAKRYLTKCHILMGRRVPVLNIQAPTPPGNKLNWYTSWEEAANDRRVDGKPALFIDSRQVQLLENVILQNETIREVMEEPYPYEYLKKFSFLVSVYHNGVLKKFRYDSRYMTMLLSWTTDSKEYEQIQQAARYENECREFVALTKRNGKALAAIALRTDLTPVERNAVNAEISKHLFLINTFSSKLPPVFVFDKKGLKADVLNANAIGLPIVIPVIVWIVAIITTGMIVISYKWATAFEEVKKQKQSLESRYKSIMSISNQTQRDNALVDASKSDSKTLEIAAENTGWLGQVKQILLVGLVAYGIKEILPLVTKKK